MVAVAPEAPSVKREITRDDILKLIPKFYINQGNYLFYKEYLEREYVLGTIGDRGGGKSGSDAVISIVDFMLRGKPVWSNMRIACDILVEDEWAMEVGLNKGGVVHFESLPLVKGELLKLDEQYRNGCLVIEEINVQFANVRRFMSNTNVDFNEMCQQLRKFRTSMIYNVIDEMFIDPQLRALTDMFIRTYDTAFDIDAMSREKKGGIDFCWNVHAMTGYLNGEQGRYAVTKKPIKAYLHFAPWRGVYNDKKHQEKGVYSLNKREQEQLRKAGLVVESSDDMNNEINEMQWLIDNVRKLKNSGLEYLEAHQLWQVLEVVEHGFTPAVIGKLLPAFGITRHHQTKYGQWVHRIETYSLENEANKQTSTAARN